MVKGQVGHALFEGARRYQTGDNYPSRCRYDALSATTGVSTQLTVTELGLTRAVHSQRRS